ncbi:hypothetical protein PUNSTDRAFT_73921 [Punctularia strigosozonata HHB-11173 SS5]|uniref:uncharacterized protein n=1 Tax=Punctularia strigosozonata (strain HHB-11173) TaxID=741275 RepID=UPI0004418078|nr:uncharacterized protein PUNSTDRAFT_73921 [Punctularia strigosozonata HHB-11173 SS5]EIN05706.1 hypothetical protein PUNSTDRAFT_73921 [Punctularia strigosozonata HHB-11173 SS5]
MVVRDIRTRWNYTHAMIRRAQKLRNPIDEWVIETKETRDIILGDDDWDELSHIADILEVSVQTLTCHCWY